MKISLLSDIPCNLFYEGVQYETPVQLFIKDEGRVQISVLPAYPERFSSYTLIITTADSRLCDLSGGARAVCWGSVIDVHLLPPVVQSHFTPEPIAQKRLAHDLITLYDDGRKKLMLEGSSFFNFDLPENLTEPTLKARELSHGALVSVTGAVEDKEYLLALSTQSNQWQIMHEIIADKIETTKTGVKASSIIPCMMRYEKREFYKPFSRKPVECDYIPTIRHTYPTELTPYLFLEDVFLKNEGALSYLHPSIGLDLDGLIEFFGDGDTAVHPDFDEFGLDCIAVYSSKSRICRPDLYRFVMEKDKIANIIHLLTCN